MAAGDVRAEVLKGNVGGAVCFVALGINSLSALEVHIVYPLS